MSSPTLHPAFSSQLLVITSVFQIGRCSDSSASICLCVPSALSWPSALQFHPLCCKRHDFIIFLRLNSLGALKYIFFFHSLSIFSLFIHSFGDGLPGLIPFWGYCEHCHNKHNITGIYLINGFQVFWVHTQQWDCWVIWKMYLYFLNKSPCHFPLWLHWFPCPMVFKSSFLHILIVTCSFLWMTSTLGGAVTPHGGFELHFPDGSCCWALPPISDGHLCFFSWKLYI